MKADKTLLTGVALAALVLPLAGQAQEAATDTLQKIKNENVLVVGYREASIPFSYYDEQQHPIGYSMDYANLIIERIKQELNLPDLKVRLLPITSQNRISLLQNGTFDFECTTTTHNESRARQVDFTNSIFKVGTRLLAKVDGGIKDFADLKGQSIVVGAGTTSEPIIRNMNIEKDMGMRIISAKDHSESFLMLSTGRVKAMMMDDALLAGERAKVRKPQDYVITGTPQSFEVCGCMVRKGDDKLRALMNEVIARAQISGKAAEIYNKWFMQPIPPKQLNLDFPMSDEMKALFAHPNDEI
ncbi:glutamate/aspartate ABC transporter substrate-binding protein [Alcaligenes sp. Marseille-Q7550]